MFKSKVESMTLSVKLNESVNLSQLSNLERKMNIALIEHEKNEVLLHRKSSNTFSFNGSRCYIKNFSFSKNRLAVTFDFTTDDIQFVLIVQDAMKEVLLSDEFKDAWIDEPNQG